MGLSTVNSLVEAHREFIDAQPDPDVFCPVCLARKGRLACGAVTGLGCFGSPEAMVRAKTPANMLDN